MLNVRFHQIVSIDQMIGGLDLHRLTLLSGSTLYLFIGSKSLNRRFLLRFGKQFSPPLRMVCMVGPDRSAH
jgi:hypothetical protein